MIEKGSHTLDDFEIRLKTFLQHWPPEQGTVGYVAHQKFNNDKQLMSGLPEPRGDLGRRSSSDSLLKMGVGLCVI
jgi:hypothetical protein